MPMRMKDLSPGLKTAAILTMLLSGACEPKLETGYVPRPLNSTAEDRRSFYAPAFTPESHPPKEHDNAADFQGLN
jgi:hypothetical protein